MYAKLRSPFYVMLKLIKNISLGSEFNDAKQKSRITFISYFFVRK